MKLWAVVLAAVLMTGCSCGVQPSNKYRGPQATPSGVCQENDIKKVECENGATVSVCKSSAWEVVSDTCTGVPECDETLFASIEPILTEKCVQCHAGYDSFETAKAKIANFINRINLPETDVRYMPRGARLNQEEKDVFYKWRADGLLDQCSSNPEFGAIDLDDIESRILEDLTPIDPASRRFIRYFIVKDGFLPGIDKGINSVSLDNRINLVQEVNKNFGLYRIDLDAYDLTRTDWQVIERFDQINFESFTSKGALIKVLTDTRKPWLHGRNFSFISHIDQIYYFLLRMPRTVDELLRLDFINIDLQEEFERLRARLIGLNSSPIALTKNRLIGRFASEENYLWFTWDVLDVNEAGSNLFIDPLIKDAGGVSNFQFDGSEIIYTLPNGLQGYYLSDGDGRRVDEAPVGLVFDTESPFDPIINMRDCSRCHYNGLLAAEDQIRDHVERNAGQFDVRDVQLVQFLFPRNELPLFNSDNRAFGAALATVGQTEGVDAVNASTDYFRQDYTPDKVAELLLVPQRQLTSCISQSGILQATIGQLLSGGTVSLDQLTQALPDVFRECGFNQERFFP